MLQACSAMFVHNEDRYPGSGLHVEFAKKEWIDMLKGLPTEDGMGEMMEGRNYNAVGTVSVCRVVYGWKSRLVERWTLTLMNVFFTEDGQ